MNAIIKIRTLLSLGLLNIIRVIWYRISVKLGINSVRNLKGGTVKPPFFNSVATIKSDLKPSEINTLDKDIVLFDYHKFELSIASINWHQNLFSNTANNKLDNWWEIPDFRSELGDIKTIWELSRYNWAVSLAQKSMSGDKTSLIKLNDLIEDWCVQNPPYKGVNWKCGQEASIRVIHLATAAIILKQVNNSNESLIDLIELHLQRIYPTISYAVAQDNNHGTSEAAALYIGGSWLVKYGNKEGIKYFKAGRKWLENRVDHLIEMDGSFSQHSLNYHRVMLDTLSFVEVWRAFLNIDRFSENFYRKAELATVWLFNLINKDTGDGPNIGANDGARLIPLTDTDYRDFRPSVQLATALFSNKAAYPNKDASYNEQLKWLGVTTPKVHAVAPESKLFNQGGYVVLRQENVMTMMRLPIFNFRPSHADALHVDLWVGGNNLLRDAGTYSYNTEHKWLDYFPGTVSHNTVQFDGRDQMPRLSRFLFGAWLKPNEASKITSLSKNESVAASYYDYLGCYHNREIELNKESLIVRDEVSGFKEKAILRWRLIPSKWVLNGTTITNGKDTLSITCDTPIHRIEMVEGWESRYYMNKELTPVLEVEIHKPGQLVTNYSWKQ